MSPLTREIKMVDLQGQYLRIKDEIDSAVLMSTEFIQGPQVKSFANALSRYNHGAHVVPCANGIDVLQITMMPTVLKKMGNEVILPVYTFVATSEGPSIDLTHELPSKE